MRKFIADECVLYFSDSLYREAFKAQGWDLQCIGDNIPRGSSDEQIYDFAVSNNIQYIITTNRNDFVSLESQKQGMRVIVIPKRVYPAQQVVHAILHSFVNEPNAATISIGKILSHSPSAPGRKFHP